jgi:hypothetical protein
MRPLACCSRVHDTDDGGGFICRIFASGSIVVASSLDILRLFPELAAIGPTELQVYCDEWLQRPVAYERGIAQIIIDERRQLQVLFDRPGAALNGDYASMPIDELLGFIVDCHFNEAHERRRLHGAIRDARQRLGEHVREYVAAIGRVGSLYLVCKNPVCKAQMVSDRKATAEQRINFGPMDITCTTCHLTFAYDGDDFKLSFET